MPQSPENNTSPAQIAEHYDTTMYQPVYLEYFGYSNFANFGYWQNKGIDQKRASEALVERLLSFLPQGEYCRILDVACGKGGTTELLVKFFPQTTHVTATNISFKQLQTARSTVPGSDFIAMDAACLGFHNETFNAILCVEAAFHFITRKDFLAEAYRILKPGGILILSDILNNQEAEKRLPYRTEKNYVKDLIDYQNLFENTGFSNIQIVDATEDCWHGCFWNQIKMAHKKLLAKEIDQSTMHAYLEKAYRMVDDIEYYVLAAACKA